MRRPEPLPAQSSAARGIPPRHGAAHPYVLGATPHRTPRPALGLQWHAHVLVWLEEIVFRNRGLVLAAAVLLTLTTGWAATRVRLDTAFEKHLPVGHEYIDTFLEYRDQMLGVNRVIVVLRAKQGDIWNPAFLARLSEATDLLAFLPGIDRRTVTSLWTPNIRSVEITEEGMRSEDIIGGDVTPESLTEQEVARIRDRVIGAGLVGRLVSNDFTAAMVVAEALGVDLDTKEQVGLLDLAGRLETEVRAPLVNDDYDVHIIGFVKLLGDIADGVTLAVGVFFGLALLMTCVAVYVYARSWLLTALAIGCSLVSGVWQFGIMGALGYGVDPLAILVPFLVFAIGVSHAIQQINAIAKRVRAGDDGMAAARVAFRSLLVPGTMALLTDLVAFATLAIIPIPVVRELAVTASIGVALKIPSNLLLLPVLASYFTFDGGFSERYARSEATSAKAMEVLGRIARPRRAFVTLGVLAALLCLASWQARDRHVGDLQAGATELRPGSRYNRDADLITGRFSFGLDVLTVLAETGEGSCIDYATLDYLDRFSWHMSNVTGVVSVMSTPVVAKFLNTAWNEGNPKWRALPRNRYALMQVTAFIPPELGVFNSDCTLMPISIFTADHKAETIERVVSEAAGFRNRHESDAVHLRLASGNVGVEAATNEVLEGAEAPMLLYAYAAIAALVLLTYRDWRAVVCCCAPLTMATALGYWFMKEQEIGLKVSTLPVMVLAVGIGVDYSFYVYSRLERHLRAGLDVARAYQNALFETGNAVVFTGLTLAVGVSTWAFSPLNFQANMGLLLAFMFITNMVMAVTALPVLAVVLHRRHPGDRGAERGRWLAVLAFVLLAPSTPASGDAAVPSPLAWKSLLLDAADTGDRIVAVGEWGHVVLSDDRGASWRQAGSVPTRTTLTGVFFIDEDRGWAVGHDAVVIHTEDGGERWTLQHDAPDLEAPLLSVWFGSEVRGIAVGAFGLRLETSDGGRRWQRAPADAVIEDRHLNDVFAARGTLFAAAEGGNVYRSQGNASWSGLELPYTGSLWGGLALGDGTILAFGMRGHAFRSEDLGTHWSAIDTGTDQSLIGATELDDGTVHIVGLGGTVLTSRDGGRTVTQTTLAHRRAIAAVVRGTEGRLVLFGEEGAEQIEAPALHVGPTE